jgi:hypothetical protein
MKDPIFVNIRWLTVFIGLFGFWCLLRAAVCVYFLSHMDLSPNGLKYLSANAISVVKHAHYGLVVSIAAFVFVASVSGVSAYGIFNRRNWAKKTWMILSIVLFIYFILSSWIDAPSLLVYILGFILCIFPWYVLWYLPRKNMQVDSCNAVTSGNE